MLLPSTFDMWEAEVEPTQNVGWLRTYAMLEWNQLEAMHSSVAELARNGTQYQTQDMCCVTYIENEWSWLNIFGFF